MTKDTIDAKAQAAAVKAALLTQGIAIKHTRAIDLVCASHGLRNRQMLGTTALTPTPAPNMARLADVATDLAKHDEQRRAAIVSTTTDVTHPNGLEVEVYLNKKVQTTRIPFRALGEPADFVRSPAFKPIVDGLARQYAYYQYFDGSNSPIERAQCNEMAKLMLDAIEEGEHPLVPVEDFFGHGDSAEAFMSREGTEIIEGVAESIGETLAEIAPDTPFDEADWSEEIEKAVADTLYDDDDSTVLDLIGQNDRAEVVFVFGEVGGMEDDMLQSHKPWSDPAEMAITRSLQFAMSQLGYSLTEFRALSGNKHKPYAQDRMMRGKRRRAKVAEWKKVSEIITEACTSYFNVVLYGYVPLRDLAKLKKGDDLVLKKFRLASYNCMSGTFHDSTRIDEITVSPKDGYLRSCHGWYTPDSICGFVMSHFEANVEAVPKVAKPKSRRHRTRFDARKDVDARADVLAMAKAKMKKRGKPEPKDAILEALREYFDLADDDGIYGTSDAAVAMGYRDRHEDEDILGKIARDLADELGQALAKVASAT